MGGSRTAGRRNPRSEVKSIPTAEIAAGLISAIQRDGAILKTEVAKRSSRTQLLEVFDALVRAGFG